MCPSTIEPCDLCDGDAWETVSARDRLGGPLQTLLCQRCGLVRHRELPDQDELSAYYRGAYREEYHGQGTPSRKRVVRAWRRGQALFTRLGARVPPGGSVLEVGAGLGLNLKPFQLSGARAYGIEPHAQFQQFSRQTLRVDVHRKGLADVEPTRDQDLIIFAHVVEHLRSPRRALQTLRGMLRPDGLLYLECPNVAAPFAQPHKLFHKAHLYNFSRSSLLMLAGRCGFALEESFAPERDPTVAVLLRASDDARLEIDPSNAQRVREAIRRTGWVAYHLRGSYLGLRAVQVGQRVHEAMTLRKAYESILAACAQTPALG